MEQRPEQGPWPGTQVQPSPWKQLRLPSLSSAAGIRGDAVPGLLFPAIIFVGQGQGDRGCEEMQLSNELVPRVPGLGGALGWPVKAFLAHGRSWPVVKLLLTFSLASRWSLHHIRIRSSLFVRLLDERISRKLREGASHGLTRRWPFRGGLRLE